MDKTYRIKDIAELSGVSAGTIDRILHKRGKVSEEARKKVEKVLKEIDYQPNLIARSLALKKKYRLICVIPSFTEGDYWEKLSQGIDKAAKEFQGYNIIVEYLTFDQYDKNSFDNIIPIIEQTDCQGVVISTQFSDGVIKLSKQLNNRCIPYVLIDSYIEDTKCIAYYGTNSHESGYLAGRLILDQLKPGEEVAVFNFINKGQAETTQHNKREKGFMAYLDDNGYKGKVHPISIHADMTSDDKQLLKKFLAVNNNVRKGIVFNSRAHILGKFFKENGIEFNLIGYDAIDANMNYMKQGMISYLIAQRPEVQGVNCIRALFRHLVLEEDVKHINYMPLDIIMKENAEFYNNYI